MTKPTKATMRPSKTRIRLGGSESSLCAQWVVNSFIAFFVRTVKTDQSGWMPRLIWVFVGRKIQIAGFVMQRLDKSNF